ncbi:helix-turn-helix transcriptional regulator [Nonomuraea sp. NPDC050404]|uniref:helix-turn-helix domain-containing protein n=1 Tax=Nonomuraea sp. NPDC050404 TaxID=3155783 RepID=UPI0034055FC0
MPTEPTTPAEAPPEVAFGRELRRLRLAEGWTLEALGARVGYSGTMVGYFELAKRPVPETFVATAEGALGLDGELAALWKEINPKHTPKWFRQWPKIEKAAVAIRTWQPLVMPGLLQTEAYAGALLRAEPGAMDEQVKEMVRARLERQSIFQRVVPPMYAAVMDEGILHRPVGGRKVMREQLEHLLTLMTHPKITIQVVPLEVGATPGLLGGFSIAQLSHGLDTAYLESASNGQVTDRADEVRAISLRYDAIRAWAHPLHITENLIRETVERYGK